MNKIFFVTYGGGHVRIVIPIIKELISRGYETTILALTMSVLDLDKEQLKYKKLQDYITLFDEKKAIYDYGRKFIDSNFEKESGLEKEEILLYIGLNLYDMSLQMGGKKAIRLYQKHGRNIFYPYHVIKKIIEYENPDCILVTCGVRAEKAAAVAGNDLNIQVIRIVDLLGEKLTIPYHAKICVINEISKQNILMQNKHLDHDDVYVTGQPNLEIHCSENDLNRFRQKYALHQYKKVLSFFTQPNNPHRDIVVKHLLDMLRKRPEYLGFVKLHPNEYMDFYTNFLSGKPDNLIIVKEEDTGLILYHSDVVMTFYSTVGLQAIAVGKPLVTIQLDAQEYPIDYSKYECAVKIRDMKDFVAVLEEILNNGNMVKRLKEQRAKISIPESSASNIADVIQKLDGGKML